MEELEWNSTENEKSPGNFLNLADFLHDFFDNDRCILNIT